MKSIDRSGNVHYSWEEEHGYENPMDETKTLRKHGFLLVRGIGFGFVITLAIIGIVIGIVRAYLYLFPQR